MKKQFSKMIGCLLAGMIFFSFGCSKQESTSALFPEGVSRDYPTTVDIAYPGFFYRNNTYDVENGDKWLQDIALRYNVDLKVTTIATDANGIIRSLLSGGHTAEVVSGFVYMNNSNLVDMYADPENILPLEDYLVNNPVWNLVPQAVRDAFTVDGHIWAIPSAYMTVSPQVRAFDKKILETLGAEVPTTLDELTQFAQKVEVLQTNGSTDVTKMIPMCSYPNYCAADILRAYGLYTSGYGMISYDPLENCIIDGFLKPDAEEALKYLRELYTNGILNMDFVGTDTNPYFTLLREQKEYASVYYAGNTTNMAYLGAMSKYALTTGITQNGTVNPQVLDISFAGYVLATNTPEPEKYVNFLLDLFFGSKYNYYETRYGSDQNYTISSDGTISINLMEDGSYPTLPNLLGRIEGLNMGDEYSGYNQQYGDSTFQYNTGIALSELRKTAIEDGFAMEVPVIDLYAVRLSSWYTRDLIQDVQLAANDCFVNAIMDSSKTVKEVLDEYRVTMRECGAQHLLDGANSVIGKTGSQKY